MPRIGLGVYLVPSGKQTREAVASGIRLGYRHIDTARLYGNEADVGRAMRGAPARGAMVLCDAFAYRRADWAARDQALVA